MGDSRQVEGLRDGKCAGTHLKCMLSTQTVVQTDSETRIIVKSRYLPSRGTASEVGGIISARSRKNTVNETSIEIHNVTCQRNVYTVSSLSLSLLLPEMPRLALQLAAMITMAQWHNGTTAQPQPKQHNNNTNNINETGTERVTNQTVYQLYSPNYISISYVYAM